MGDIYPNRTSTSYFTNPAFYHVGTGPFVTLEYVRVSSLGFGWALIVKNDFQGFLIIVKVEQTPQKILF